MSSGPRKHGESFKAYRKRLAKEERLLKRFLKTGRYLYRSTKTSIDGKTLISTGPAMRDWGGSYKSWYEVKSR